MIYHFDGVAISDDTREIRDGVTLLETPQNAPYRAGSNFPTIQPQELLRRFQLDLSIVGVTGTNGKTTTTAAIYSMLNDLGHKAALQGSRGFFIADRLVAPKTHTTPPLLQTLYHLYLAKKAGAKFFVMEVSSHAIDQGRIAGLPFALKVITNISQDHLDYHKSMERYIATKNSFLADESRKLVNKEDPRVSFNPKNARTYAIEELATYRILAYSLEDGIDALVGFGSELAPFSSPLRGLFNLSNLLAAIGSVHMLTGCSLQEVCQVVEHFGGVRGRMEVVSTDPLIIVDFAHTPDGMAKVFESFPGKKLVALFGAGGDRDRSKRPQMGAVAARFCKRIYLTSDNPRSEEPRKIIEEIRSAIPPGYPLTIEVDRGKAIERAIRELGRDEVLLILGKGDEEYIEQKGEQIPFCDREAVQQALSRLG
ncbi:MAG: UDP-N-acetylmuramoyl-L-alanyl-D-glutamate--2,6-diaminopimelate ligase [Nitratiruptor sp.]|nr:UDP-N-acetylmuramoyl-L-alanyl-D-glutamate--2,6-diaminopimelate ligase [Nitratiruptor sp.]NPA83568.1 UDP-N-acetylmuramoyl-L-alanyl-D-glutamate--2,6-diaminopimelate ligase [Campylobacterota bacterium]